MIRCCLCGHEIRRRWWQWWILQPLAVHDWRMADQCNANRGVKS